MSSAIEAWRMKNTAPMVERDGKIWWWCPKHVIPGRYDGLYVTHKPEDHEEWVQKKEDRKAKFMKERKLAVMVQTVKVREKGNWR